MSESSLLRYSGLAFVGLFVASAAMFGELMGAFGDPDQVFEEYYGKAANRRADIAGAYLLTASGLAFLFFSSALRAQVVRENSGLLGQVAASSAVLLSAVLMVAAATLATVSLSISFGEAFGDERSFSAGYAMVPQIGAVLMVVVAPFVAAFHIAVLAFAGRRLFSRFVTTASFACAFALLFSIFYLPLIALPAWVLMMAFKASPR